MRLTGLWVLSGWVLEVFVAVSVGVDGDVYMCVLGASRGCCEGTWWRVGRGAFGRVGEGCWRAANRWVLKSEFLICWF